MNSNGKFLTFEEYQNKFEIKANYLHYFQLIAAIPPVVHRIITTKKELLKYKLASDDKCPFCLNPDSNEHTFLYC